MKSNNEVFMSLPVSVVSLEVSREPEWPLPSSNNYDYSSLGVREAK